MNGQGQGSDGTPGDPYGTPGTPGAQDEVWLRFLTDSESAIRACALKEPSADERVSGRAPRPAADRETERPRPLADGHDDHPSPVGSEAVGALWQRDYMTAGPAWRDLDGRARLRLVGRAVTTAVAIALALVVWSRLSPDSGTGTGEPTGDVVQQLEDAPGDLPATTPAPQRPVSADPSSPVVRHG
ncbi:hypothetical protein [Streptomyces sp. NPDC058735]|uniref:hypothetical protein n=1 Tax=unclassified Streptomyces TaxID=2593676 RepID=UPI003686C373